jgi:CDP-glycerol glycerophosphotransferase (TagB/SpsB family)
MFPAPDDRDVVAAARQIFEGDVVNVRRAPWADRFPETLDLGARVIRNTRHSTPCATCGRWSTYADTAFCAPCAQALWQAWRCGVWRAAVAAPRPETTAAAFFDALFADITDGLIEIRRLPSGHQTFWAPRHARR